MENEERWKRRKIGKAQMERSKFSDHTNYRNTKSDSAKSISSLSPLCLVPSLFCPPQFHIFHFILWSHRAYYCWGTSCIKFSLKELSLNTRGAGSFEFPLLQLCGRMKEWPVVLTFVEPSAALHWFIAFPTASVGPISATWCLRRCTSLTITITANSGIWHLLTSLPSLALVFQDVYPSNYGP